MDSLPRRLELVPVLDSVYPMVDGCSASLNSLWQTALGLGDDAYSPHTGAWLKSVQDMALNSLPSSVRDFEALTVEAKVGNQSNLLFVIRN